MLLEVDRVVGLTGRSEKIIRLPAFLKDPAFEPGHVLRLRYDGRVITLEPTGQVRP